MNRNVGFRHAWQRRIFDGQIVRVWIRQRWLDRVWQFARPWHAHRHQQDGGHETSPMFALTMSSNRRRFRSRCQTIRAATAYPVCRVRASGRLPVPKMGASPIAKMPRTGKYFCVPLIARISSVLSLVIRSARRHARWPRKRNPVSVVGNRGPQNRNRPR